MIDWKGFEEGALTPEEMNEIAGRLSSDPHVKAQYDQFKAFRAAIKSACLSQPVPEESLKACLRGICAERQTVPRPRVWMVGFAAAAAAIVLAVIVGPQFLSQPATKPVAQDNGTEFFRRLSTVDPNEAHKFIVSTAHRPAPRLLMANSNAKICCALVGKDWIGYDLILNGKSYRVVGKQNSNPKKDCSQVWQAGRNFWVDQNGVSWRCEGNMLYTVTGGDQNERMTLASIVSKDTPSLSL